MNKNFKKMQCIVAVITLMLLAGCDKPLKVPSIVLSNTPYTANIPDNEVTKNIQMALLTRPELKAFDINVITLKGDVRLTGVVDTQSQIDAVIKLARETEGAHAINNKLTINK
jgi:hyperosmotically inducible protein